MFRPIASLVVFIVVFGAWFFTNETNTTQPAGNTTPSSDQVPAQPKPANSGGKNFNL
jgi:hypothetical protein